MNALSLARLEWLKTQRRISFWMGLLLFFGLLISGLSFEYYSHLNRPERLAARGGWTSVLSTIETLGLLVTLAIIVLLTASEKTWRTERQNVIDGLSRNQYFAGKLIVVVAFALLLWLGSLIVGSVFELLNRALLESPDRAFLSRVHALRLSGVLLYLLFVGCIALFFGSVASGSGAALALAFLLLFVQAPIAFQMARQGGAWHEATAFLPMQVLSSLSTAITYNADGLANMQAQARANGFPMLMAAAPAAVAATFYSVVFCVGAWLSISRRDL